MEQYFDGDDDDALMITSAEMKPCFASFLAVNLQAFDIENSHLFSICIVYSFHKGLRLKGVRIV